MSDTIYIENGRRVYPCRCGQTHRGDYAAEDWNHHNCFHTARLWPVSEELDPGHLICSACGMSFRIAEAAHGLVTSGEERDDQPAGHGSERVTLYRWKDNGGRGPSPWSDDRDNFTGIHGGPLYENAESADFIPADSLDQRLADAHDRIQYLEGKYGVVWDRAEQAEARLAEEREQLEQAKTVLRRIVQGWGNSSPGRVAAEGLQIIEKRGGTGESEDSLVERIHNSVPDLIPEGTPECRDVPRFASQPCRDPDCLVHRVSPEQQTEEGE
jgi:hypothetical protein